MVQNSNVSMAAGDLGNYFVTTNGKDWDYIDGRAQFDRIDDCWGGGNASYINGGGVFGGYNNRSPHATVGPNFAWKYSVINIAQAPSDGFLVLDSITNCASADPTSIDAITNTTVTVLGSAYDRGFRLGDNICRPAVDFFPVNTSIDDTTNLTEYTIPDGILTENKIYRSRVKYTSNSNPAINSLFSDFSQFKMKNTFIPQPGDEMGGGFFAGQTNVGGTIYNLILAPIQVGPLLGQKGGQFPTAIKNGAGASGVTTGETNFGSLVTQQMSNNGSPAAEFIIIDTQGPNAGTYDITNSTGTGIGGFNDWYMPAQNELQVIYYYLKPGTEANVTVNLWSVGNPIAVNPQPTTAWTATNPKQTSITIFKSGGSEAFSTDGDVFGWWTSTLTNIGANSGMLSSVQAAFKEGNATNYDTTNSTAFVRAIRREAA
jgi:hypothetical protein